MLPSEVDESQINILSHEGDALAQKFLHDPVLSELGAVFIGKNGTYESESVDGNIRVRKKVQQI